MKATIEVEMEMKDAGSPESVPSLAELSEASMDGEEDNYDEGVQLVCEMDSTMSSNLGIEHRDLHAMLDDDDKHSVCSSGILSAESLDISLDDSQHSFASMKTVKSKVSGDTKYVLPVLPNPEPCVVPDPLFESVAAEDIPVDRSCHGALNITPRQLGEIFALFSSESKSKQQCPPPVSPAKEEQPLKNIPIIPVPSPPTPEDFPTRVAKRNRNATNQRSLSAELFWKPRAKSLEKECAALKEIIRIDSSNILRLKTALETLRENSSRHIADIRSLKAQMNSITVGLNEVKREREMLKEHEIEHLETIRILKHEVDILTRDAGKILPDVDSACPEGAHNGQPAVDQEELRQLRLENQLFASQIVEYEEELSKSKSSFSFMASENEQLKLEMESIRKQMEDSAIVRGHKRQRQSRYDPNTRVSNTADQIKSTCASGESISSGRQYHTGIATLQQGNEDGTPSEQYANEMPPGATEQPPMDLQLLEMEEDGSSNGSATKESNYILASVNSLLEEIEQPRNANAQELVSPQADGNQCISRALRAQATTTEDWKAGSDDESDPETCLERLKSDLPTEMPNKMLGNVLGIFAVGNFEGKESEQDQVYVVQDQLPESQTAKHLVQFLQWQSPGEPPAFVEAENVGISEAEDRNPPATCSFDDSIIGTSFGLQHCSVRDVMTLHKTDRSAMHSETTIDVLQATEESEAIEVQLREPPAHDDSAKENDSRSHSCQEDCNDRCDAWSMVSDCLFTTHEPHVD